MGNLSSHKTKDYSLMEIEAIYLQALRGAVEASNRIMEIYLAGFEAEYKLDGSPITLADTASTSYCIKMCF